MKILVGARPTPRCNRVGRSAAGKLLPRKRPARSLVPTKTICSCCMDLSLSRRYKTRVVRRLLYCQLGPPPTHQDEPIHETDDEPSDSERHGKWARSEEHTSELQSLRHLVCRLLLE